MSGAGEGSPTKRVQKKGHAQVSCRRCHNVVTLLYRNLEMAKLPEFSQMDPDQAKQFFQKAKETMVGGQFSFGRIKGLLTNTLTEIERQVSSTSVKGKYHPLEVWASKGYNAKSIEEKCEWKNSALFLGGCLWHCGEFDVVLFLLFFLSLFASHLFVTVNSFSFRFGRVYKVPVLSEDYEYLRETVSSRIMAAERRMASNKKRGLVLFGKLVSVHFLNINLV